MEKATGHKKNLLERVLRIKKIVEKSQSEGCSVIEKLDDETIAKLAATDGFPEDMLVILREIGSVRDWSFRGCMQIHWWIPCDYATAKLFERFYCTEPRLLEKIENDLLFFANDCNAAGFFYDRSTSPWSVREFDTLSYSSSVLASDPALDFIASWPDNRDAVSIIEEWAESIAEFQE